MTLDDDCYELVNYFLHAALQLCINGLSESCRMLQVTAEYCRNTTRFHNIP